MIQIRSLKNRLIRWIERIVEEAAQPQSPQPAEVTPTAGLPEGWTDDLTIHVRPPQTLEELVELVLQAEVRKVPQAATTADLMTQFGLSEEDAELAWDRTLGGLVRAATGNPANCPVRERDPVAWISYHRCLREPALIAAIRPQYATDK